MPASSSGVGLQILPLGARVAAAALNYALLVVLSRGLHGDNAASVLGACLLELPLLQQLVSFIAREGTARAAARCTSSHALDEAQQANNDLQKQSSFNLSYISFFACCCVSLLSVPVWLYLFLPEHGNSYQGESGAVYAYSLTALAFAAAGLVDAAAEVLSMRCLVLRSPNSRNIAEALSAAARSMLLAGALLMQQWTRTAEATATRSVLMNPMVAFGGSHLCSSFIFLQVLWFQCYRLVTLTAAAQQSPNAGEASAALSYVDIPRLLVAWPAFQRLRTNSFSSSGVVGRSFGTRGGGSPTSGAPEARAAAAGTKGPLAAALHWALGRYISAEHLELLPTYVILLAQKMLLQQGEQLLLLLLLDGKAAAEYALTSGAASVLCRVVFSQFEAAAFEGFCALQKQPAVVSLAAAADAAPDGAAFATGRLPGKASAAAAWKEECESAGDGKCAEEHLQLRSNALDLEPSKRNQRLPCELQRHQQVEAHCCGGSGSYTEKSLEGSNCNRSAVPGILGSQSVAMLVRLLGRRNLTASEVISPSHSPAVALLQLLLLLQGTLGLAAAAGGWLFAAPALRCVFGPSTVAPGSGFVQTLQVYCCYVCCLSFFGLLDAYASASCSSSSLRLLKRCYVAVTAAHLVLLLPLSVRFSAAFGIPAGAGAAAAQVMSAVFRIGCCCLSISKDFGKTSGQRLGRKQNAGGYSAAPQQLVSQRCSDCRRRVRGEGCNTTKVSSALKRPTRRALTIVASGERRWDNKTLSAVCTILPPGAASLALRYSCCFVAAAVAQNFLRQASFEKGEGTGAAAKYDSQQVTLGGYVVSLWIAEMLLAFVVCAASIVAAGPLLIQRTREVYCLVAGAPKNE